MSVTNMIDIPPDAVVVHEPHGFVHLHECNATDLMVVNAARVSFAKQSEWANEEALDLAAANEEDCVPQLHDADEKVLRFLLKNRHGTPFEQTFFTFHIRAPIFVFREWHRHRIGISINEESARYVQLKPDFYLPDDEHVRVQHGKPGNYTFEPMGHELIIGPPPHDGTQSYGDHTRSALERAYLAVYGTYEHLMEIGVAKEIARACLPVGIYSQMLWSCNARSLMSFLSLRNAPKALREIHDYAEVMEDIFMKEMPVTAAAFVENGRVAP